MQRMFHQSQFVFALLFFTFFLFAQLYEMQILIASAWLKDDDDQYKIIQLICSKEINLKTLLTFVFLQNKYC